MLARLKIAVLSAAVALMLGFGAGVAFEHRPAWGGLVGRLAGESLAAQRDKWRDIATRYEVASDDWRGALIVCESERSRTASAGKASVEARSAEADARGGHAFDEGYAAGRVAGGLSCRKGEPDGQADPAGGGLAGAGAGGVRDAEDDLARRFNARAYKPG